MQQFQYDRQFVMGRPDGWLDLSTLVFAGPPRGDFSPSITVSRERLDRLVTAQQYAANQLSGLREEFGGLGLEFLGEGPIELHNASAWQRVHSFRMPDSAVVVRQWQTYVIRGDTAITVTCTDTESAWEQTLPTFRSAIGSLRLV